MDSLAAAAEAGILDGDQYIAQLFATKEDMRRREQQKTDPALKGMRWSLLKDADKLNLAQLTDLEALISQYTTNRTARARMYREQLCEILDRKQIHVISKMLRRWATSSFDDLVQYNDGFRTNLIGTPQQIAERVS